MLSLATAVPPFHFAANEFLARDLLVHLDIAARQFRDQFGRRIGQLFVLVRIAMVLEPHPQEFLVEIFRLFALLEPRTIGRALPESR